MGKIEEFLVIVCENSQYVKLLLLILPSQLRLARLVKSKENGFRLRRSYLYIQQPVKGVRTQRRDCLYTEKKSRAEATLVLSSRL